VTNLCVPAIGPAFYVYTRAVTEPAFRWRWSLVLHVALPLTFLVLQLLVWTVPVLRDGTPGDPANDRVVELAAFAVIDSYLLAYIGIAVLRLRRHRESLQLRAEEGRLQPLRGLITFSIVLWITVAVSTVGDFSSWSGAGTLVAGVGGAIGAFMLLWNVTLPTHLTGGRVPAVSLPVLGSASPPAAAGVEVADGPAKSGALKPDEAARLIEKLRRALDQERVFLDPELSLATLADHIGTTRHKVSLAFREGYGATFYQVVGRYRVRHAAALLRSREGQVQTIAGIAMTSGFNTLSAFNAAFRSEFGVPPSEYRTRGVADVTGAS
jgi:AraC-like DNA-binding protein